MHPEFFIYFYHMVFKILFIYIYIYIYTPFSNKIFKYMSTKFNLNVFFFFLVFPIALLVFSYYILYF